MNYDVVAANADAAAYALWERLNEEFAEPELTDEDRELLSLEQSAPPEEEF